MEEELARSIYYNPDTLDVWLADPSSAFHAEALTDNLVAKYNQQADVIGFEVI